MLHRVIVMVRFIQPSLFISGCLWVEVESEAGFEVHGDVALYSGLAAGLVIVATLVIIVTLYRRSQSEYTVDAIDASALTGGFQSFSFKRNTQGQNSYSIRIIYFIYLFSLYLPDCVSQILDKVSFLCVCPPPLSPLFHATCFSWRQ